MNLRLVLSVLTLIHTAAAQPPRPNILMIVVDDLGWNGFGFNGNNTEVISPHVDALARSGVILGRHYVYKFCSPSRAAFLTGRVPGHGIWEINPPVTMEATVNPNMTMIPAMLKTAGYVTYHVGKWHQGYYRPAYTPHGRGFDKAYSFLNGGEDHFTQCVSCPNHIAKPDWSNYSVTCAPDPSECNLTCPEQGGIDLYLTDAPAFGYNGTYDDYAYSQQAIQMLSAHNKSQPFFMYLALHNVHQPVEAPVEFIERYPASDYNATNHDRRIYNAMHSGADEVVGNVTAFIRSLGLDVTIVLTADNGGTYEHRPSVVEGSSNYPLRGHKYSFFEGGIRGAAFVNSPLLPPEVIGTTIHIPIHITDWWVTFCNLAGVKPDDGYATAPPDGVDVWPIVTGKSTERPASQWYASGGLGPNELLLGVGGGTDGAYVNGTLKLIVGTQDTVSDSWSAQYYGTTPTIPAPGTKACSDAPCLFDIAADYREMSNLAKSHPVIASRMLARYKELVAKMQKPNGFDEQIQHVVFDKDLNRHVYHGPPPNTDPCPMVKRTGFWAPWER